MRCAVECPAFAAVQPDALGQQFCPVLVMALEDLAVPGDTKIQTTGPDRRREFVAARNPAGLVVSNAHRQVGTTTLSNILRSQVRQFRQRLVAPHQAVENDESIGIDLANSGNSRAHDAFMILATHVGRRVLGLIDKVETEFGGIDALVSFGEKLPVKAEGVEGSLVLPEIEWFGPFAIDGIARSPVEVEADMNAVLVSKVDRAVDLGEHRFVRLEQVVVLDPECIAHRQPNEVKTPVGDPAKVILANVTAAGDGKEIKKVEAAHRGRRFWDCVLITTPSYSRRSWPATTLQEAEHIYNTWLPSNPFRNKKILAGPPGEGLLRQDGLHDRHEQRVLADAVAQGRVSQFDNLLDQFGNLGRITAGTGAFFKGGHDLFADGVIVADKVGALAPSVAEAGLEIAGLDQRDTDVEDADFQGEGLAVTFDRKLGG